MSASARCRADVTPQMQRDSAVYAMIKRVLFDMLRCYAAMRHAAMLMRWRGYAGTCATRLMPMLTLLLLLRRARCCHGAASDAREGCHTQRFGWHMGTSASDATRRRLSAHLMMLR